MGGKQFWCVFKVASRVLYECEDCLPSAGRLILCHQTMELHVLLSSAAPYLRLLWLASLSSSMRTRTQLPTTARSVHAHRQKSWVLGNPQVHVPGCQRLQKMDTA